MKIAHVVTLLSPDGSFGGPTRVAANLAKAMQNLGEEVVIYAGSRGYEVIPRELNSVPLKAFPVRQVVPGIGFSGLLSLDMELTLKRELKQFDVVHIHMARDLLTLPAALLALQDDIPTFIQCHGMIDRSDRILAKILDLFATGRVFRGASEIFYLTEMERNNLLELGVHESKLYHIPNGVPESGIRRNTQSNNVLFMARLHSRKRPDKFIEAAVRLVDVFPHITFSLVGPDGGEANRVREQLHLSGSDRIKYEGSLSPNETLSRMADAKIYVLPSINEPYPMSALEAMSVGLPVILTNSCGLATEVGEANAGIIIDDTVESLTSAISLLLSNNTIYQAMSLNAWNLARTRFSLSAVADQLLNQYKIFLR
jgi:glycosyltransferase involved in cell wall biosynthesis